MTTLTHLPSELLSSILGQLDTPELYACTLTNHVFYNAAMPLLWHHVYLYTEEHLTHVTRTLNTSPYSFGTHVRTLQLRTKALTDPSFLFLLQQVPLLTHLALEVGENITDTSFQHVARLCPQLERLSIMHALITTPSMIMLAPLNCLHSLTLFFCPSLDDPTTFLSGLNHEALTNLELTPCNLIHEPQKHAFAEATAQAVARFQHLERLHLANHNNDYTSFITTSLTHGWTWPHLTYLCLDGCPSLDDATVIPFLQQHRHLRDLAISRSKITDTTLDAITSPDFTQWKCISVMFNPGITAPGIFRLVNRCVSPLEDGVYFYGCEIHVTDDDFPIDDLDPSFYDIEEDYYGPHHEVIWLAGNTVFDDDDDDQSTR